MMILCQHVAESVIIAMLPLLIPVIVIRLIGTVTR